MTLMPVDKVNPCCKFPPDPVMIVTLLSVSVVMMTGRGGELVPPPHHLPHTPRYQVSLRGGHTLTNFARSAIYNCN